jgi:hypothetical protein
MDVNTGSELPVQKGAFLVWNLACSPGLKSTWPRGGHAARRTRGQSLLNVLIYTPEHQPSQEGPIFGT